jgi:hypothetical protein
MESPRTRVAIMQATQARPCGCYSRQSAPIAAASPAAAAHCVSVGSVPTDGETMRKPMQWIRNVVHRVSCGDARMGSSFSQVGWAFGEVVGRRTRWHAVAARSCRC